MATQAAIGDLDWEDVKKGLRRLLPTLRSIAALTPNKVDDKAVEFLASLLTDDTKMQAAVHLAGS